MRTRVLITGGGGFIGSHLAARCVDMGQDAHILVRPTTSLGRLAGIKDRLSIHRGDIGDAAALRACLDRAQPHHVYHLATRTRPPESAAMATPSVETGNLSLLLRTLSEMAEPPAILVRAGSIAEYGATALPFRENQREAPQTPYAAELVEGTKYIRLLQPMLPFPVVTARLALVYGLRQSRDFLIPALIRHCIRGEPITVHRPEDRRDLIYIDDVVDALTLIATTPPPRGSVINIATGIALTMREAARLVLDATGADPALVRLAERSERDGVSELRASTEVARQLLGWQALTPLAKGIATTVALARARERVAA